MPADVNRNTFPRRPGMFSGDLNAEPQNLPATSGEILDCPGGGGRRYWGGLGKIWKLRTGPFPLVRVFRLVTSRPGSSSK